MRKFKFMMAAALVFAAPMLFTSCDDDPWYDDGWRYDDQWWSGYDDGGWNWNENYWDNGGYYNGDDQGQGNTVLDEAEVLNGKWGGQMVYTNGDTGEQSQFYANMTFARNDGNAIKGTGIEVDYTLNSNNEVDKQQTLEFNWYIDENTGDIYIHYLTPSGSTFVMDISASQHGFELVEGQYFRGYMIGTNNRDMIYIDLDRVTNNEAKSGTRAAGWRSFGSNIIKEVKGGTMGLSGRR